MVEEHGTDCGLTPEAKLADRLIARHGLTPPMDVRHIASIYADIQEDFLPVPSDAVAIHHPRDGARPLIVLDKKPSITEERRRFTLAHEIGHIVIPWHPGTIACRADQDDVYVSIDHYGFEAEANRFASELLLPTAWVKQKILQIKDVEQVFYELKQDAMVSFAAARIKLIKCLCSGWVVAECTTNGELLKMEWSPGTPIGLYMDYSDRSNPPKFFQAMADHSVEGFTVRRGATVIRWWRLDSRERLPSRIDGRHSTEILETIISSVSVDPIVRGRLLPSINGKIGATNTREVALDKESLYGALRLRFQQTDVLQHPHLGMIVMHPDFDLFLGRKASEIIARSSVKRK